MISPKLLFETLTKNNVGFYAGVPDSLLKDVCAYFTDHVEMDNHIIAANEGAAVSLGIGYHLATNNLPLIYMQNSGLGNAINPLVSLADPAVYSIPMILMIGWRGEPGRADEPQHKKQGDITLDMLEALDISYSILSEQDENAETISMLDNLCDSARKGNKPVALVVKSGAFSKYALKTKTNIEKKLLSREHALAITLDFIPKKSILVATTGMLSRELFELRKKSKEQHEKDFLTVGGMGHASQIALGIAIQHKQKQVFCLDGDGSLIMHMGSLAINAASKASNFHHLVFNNNVHDSVGGQPTAAGSVNICAAALSLGYSWSKLVSTDVDIKDAIKRIQEIDGPSLIEVRIKPGHRIDLGRPTIKPIKNKQNFMDFLNYE